MPATQKTNKELSYSAIVETTIKDNNNGTKTFFPENIEEIGDGWLRLSGHYQDGEAWTIELPRALMVMIKYVDKPKPKMM